jgi:hypothetical protein
MLQKRQKALARAPSTRDPKQKLGKLPKEKRSKTKAIIPDLNARLLNGVYTTLMTVKQYDVCCAGRSLLRGGK